MKIVIAPDKFKGTLSAWQAAEAIRAGIMQAESFCVATYEIYTSPMADGGEGSLSSILGDNGTYVTTNTFDALMRPIEATYGILPDTSQKVAVIEAASSVGLYLIDKKERNPAVATSFGLGCVIRAAIAEGCQEIIVTVGGTATSDCGAGMLAALGCRLYDSAGAMIEHPTGSDTARILHIDISAMQALTQGVRFRILCDVDNPLLGTNGAATVFAPQKGANPATVRLLEAGAANFASIAAHATGNDYARLSGSGAAGGISWALATFCGAELLPGAPYIAEITGLHDKIKGSDLVITGEGKFDEQSLHGKVVGFVASVAQHHGIPVVAVCGTRTRTLSKEQLAAAGISHVYALTDSVPHATATAHAESELKALSLNIFKYLRERL